MTSTLASLLAVVVLAALHLAAGKLRFLEGYPRSVWLSLAGSVSVAYVFVQLLPELNEGQEAVAEVVGEGLAFIESHVCVLAPLGLAVFYGLEWAAMASGRRRRAAGTEDGPSAGVFWLHIGSFAAYNPRIGYVLHQRVENSGRRALVLFAVAMGLHFVVNDYGLLAHHKQD